MLLYKVLFIVFAFFMENGYNGVTRHLLKMFITQIESVIKNILNLKKNTEIGYLIAIFESFVQD